MKIGIIREGKIPPDSRVPLGPEQCRRTKEEFEVEIQVQSSENRCFVDESYREMGIQVVDDIGQCDILLGVKEVPIGHLIPEKTYLFFSHTIKGQAYNMPLLNEILKRHIKLIDYEVLTDQKGNRLIAFGVFAGMVGAYNGMMIYGKRSGRFELDRLFNFYDYEEAKRQFVNLNTGRLRVVLTGTGRVGNGAALVLKDMGLREVSPDDYLGRQFREAVFTQLGSKDYAKHQSEDMPFDRQHFHAQPWSYASSFQPYLYCSDLLINGMFWDHRAPVLFTREQMLDPTFSIQVVADITCDIAPQASVPCTVRPSTIPDPVYGYDPKTNAEANPFQEHAIDVMAVDNLPNELPRDASRAFGEMFIEHVLPEFLKPQSAMLDRATITEQGELQEHYAYLEEFLEGVDS